MTLFSMGPVPMFPHTLEISKQQIPYFRTPEFSEIMLESEYLLKKCIGAKKEDKVAFLTASGTAAMEATVFNCFDKKDKLLVVDGGIFGHRFVEICQAYGIPHSVISLDFGETFTEEHLEPYLSENYTAFLVNIHETSTGQLYDIRIISDFCKKKDMYLVVDAISSFLADPYEMSEYGIDATILSSQKGLAIGPGMSFVILSARIYEERILRITPPSLYFDFKEHIRNQSRGQTPYTPAVRVALELNDMLKHLMKESVQGRLQTVKYMVDKFRNELTKMQVQLPPYPLSYAETPLLFDTLDIDATDDIYYPLKNNYDIILTPCGGDLKEKLVRVGHIGYHTQENYNELLEKLKLVISIKAS